MAVMSSPEFSNLLTDPTQQTRALEILERLRADENGWRECVQNLMGTNFEDLQRDFLLLAVVEHYLGKKYVDATLDDQNMIKGLLAHCMQCLLAVTSAGGTIPAFFKNKIAHVMSLVFVVDFPSRWPRLMHEVYLDNLNQSVHIVELYLRTLMAIDSQVADREIQRTKEELERNTRIKDSMRDICVNEVMASCRHILMSEEYSGKCHELCLNVLGAYIGWVDVKLCVNDEMMPIIITRLNEEETVEPASDMICCLLSKGMHPVEKLQLIRVVDQSLANTQIYCVQKDTDPDRLACLASIINAMGVELISTYNLLSKEGQASYASETIELLTCKCTQLLALLAVDDTSVSSSVIEFAHQFVQLLKPLAPLSQQQQLFVQQLLNTVLQRYRLPDDYNHDFEGEDEIDFLDYRKELKLVATNIGMLDDKLLMNTICDYVDRVLPVWQQSSLNDVELALSLVYFIGEVVSTNQATLFKEPKEPKYIRIRDSIKLVVTSGVSNQGHMCVSLLFHEIVCRYDKLFAIESHLVGDVLRAFLDGRGLHHSSKRVRSRAVYLFCRFVKLQKQIMQDFVDEILVQIEDLLRIVLPTSSDAVMPEPLITVDDQLFVYETTGTLIVAGNFAPEKKHAYMLNLVGVLNERFNQGLCLFATAIDEKHRQLVIDYLINIMSFASRTTKAFSSQQSMQACQCSEIFIQLMQTFVASLCPERAALLNGLRQYLHRMVICLEIELLPFLPHINQQFVNLVNDTKSLTDYVILIQQICAKYKAASLDFLKGALPPLYVKLWSTLDMEGSAPQVEDQSRQHEVTDLRKSYIQLCTALTQNDTFDALFDNGDEFRERVQLSLPNVMLQTTDPLVHKGIFACWARMLQYVTTHQQHAVWMTQCLYQHVLPSAFELPLQTSFDVCDAQCMLVLHETAHCIRHAHTLKGDELLSVINDRYLTEQPDTVKQQMFAAIRATDNKQLHKFLKNYFTAKRGGS